jgi:glycerol-3-phosphate acyltransferase PlsY
VWSPPGFYDSAILVIIALLPVAYLLGTFPSAVMVARSRGIDIHSVGSGNPGASNVARTMGNWWGVLVFALDGLKGALPAAAGLGLDTRPGAYVLVAAAVLGHMYPVTRGLRGGKGVATMGGAMIVLQPVVFGVLLGVWVIARRATGTASVGSILIGIGLPVGVAIKGAPGWEIAAIIGLAALVMLRHTDNIKRLIAGRELSASRSRG